MTITLFGIVRICSFLFKCKYLKKEKHFLHVLFHLWYLHQIWKIFEIMMIMIANVFPQLMNVKDLLRPLTKNLCFRTSFDSQHVKWSQTLVKSAWQHSYHIFWSLSGQMIWKTSLALKLEILGAFVNTLAAHEVYPVRDCQNLQFNIEMELS